MEFKITDADFERIRKLALEPVTIPIEMQRIGRAMRPIPYPPIIVDVADDTEGPTLLRSIAARFGTNRVKTMMDCSANGNKLLAEGLALEVEFAILDWCTSILTNPANHSDRTIKRAILFLGKGYRKFHEKVAARYIRIYRKG